MNLDTGAAATAIPTDLNLDGHARTPPQDVNYKTASAECLADEGGVVLKGRCLRKCQGVGRACDWSPPHFGIGRKSCPTPLHGAGSTWRSTHSQQLPGWKGICSLHGEAAQEVQLHDTCQGPQWDLLDGLLDRTWHLGKALFTGLPNGCKSGVAATG